MLFACPICKEKLNSDSTRVFCARGHSFDRSRDGYYNLLVGRGGAHGDNADMVRARRAFLEGGYYEPLRQTLAEEVASHGTAPAVVDAGCGEGYYTEGVYNRLRTSAEAPSVFGFDISRDAARLAAKRVRGAEFAVASAYGMPLSDCSVDVVYNVFSPLAIDEVRRVLRKDGAFIMVIPAEEHLFSLKEKIYDTPYKNKVGDKHIEGFRLLRERELRYTVSLPDEESVLSLFMMTPYAYRTSAQGRARVLSLSRLDVDAHFLILHYQKT